MTQEEIQQKAYEVYPLDLDRHLIIEGEPYDNNRVKREAYIRGLTDSKPELPSNLDQAAEEFYKEIEHYPLSLPLYNKHVRDSFKAGAEWMAGQGYTVEGIVICDKELTGGYKDIVMSIPDGLKVDDKVTIQIRKRQ